MNNTNKTAASKIKAMCLIAVSCAIICVLTQISIPLPLGVPMTLQTLIIPIIGLVLGTKYGTIATLLYVLVGAVGLPVFSNFQGGIGAILNLTGGFIVSFPLMAFLAGLFEDKAFAVAKSRKKLKYFVILLLGLLLGAVANYLIGTVWFALVSGNTLGYSFMACVVPFIPTSIMKIIICLIAAPLLKTALVRAGILSYAS